MMPSRPLSLKNRLLLRATVSACPMITVLSPSVVAGPGLGKLKEAVFQLVMTQLDPSGVFIKAIHSAERVGIAAFKRVSDLPVTPASLKNLAMSAS